MKFLFFLFLSIANLSCQKAVHEKSIAIVDHINPKTEKLKFDVSKTEEKAKEALVFCKEKGYNADFCILIDMSLHSGLKRFFVYDFKKKEISKEYLVGHGCGDSPWSQGFTRDNPSFSNVENSHRSSLGKYKIGARGVSSWGVHVKYLMHGLEKSNSNAMKRIIVFHSWGLMNDNEVYPKGSPEGWGCPTVSNNAFQEIDPLLKNSKRPVLMWIYN